ncbi:MAG: hypothetical protein JJT81_00645 [Rubellimicrobium sp.]|nr:hypothetical protein [Rubellimicrobium sp.]
MEVLDNLHSRVVLWLKVTLPLIALVLLSTLFLFARGSRTDLDIPFAEIEEIAREARITEPRFAGIAIDGSVMSMTAEAIRPVPGDPDAFTITDVRIVIETPDGAHIDLRAGQGALDGRARMAQLSGLVRIAASSGYVMETGGVEADLQAGVVRSIGPLEVRAPYGSITAGSLTVAPAPEGRGQQLVFQDGVRLIYDPQN